MNGVGVGSGVPGGALTVGITIVGGGNGVEVGLRPKARVTVLQARVNGMRISKGMRRFMSLLYSISG
jgi:hypothetical protein